MDGKDPNFDPYHKWLAIPKGQRPPTLYQLLGLSQGETDSEVIAEAAIRQTTHVRAYQIGPLAETCTKILNEIAQARQILTNAQKRQAYDLKLAQKFGTGQQQTAVATPVVARPVPPPVSTNETNDNPFAEFADEDAVTSTPHSAAAKRPSRPASSLSGENLKALPNLALEKKSNLPLIIGGVSAGVVALGVLVGALMWAIWGSETPPDKPNPPVVVHRPHKIEPPPPPIEVPRPKVEPPGNFVAGIPIERPYITDAPALRHVVAFSTDVPTKNLVPLMGDALYTGSGPVFRLLNPMTGQTRGQLQSDLVEGFVIAGHASGDSLIAYRPGDPIVRRINHNSGEISKIGNDLPGKRGEITCMTLSPFLPLVAVGLGEGQVSFINTFTKSAEMMYGPGIGDIRAIAVAPGEPVFAIIGTDGWAAYHHGAGGKPAMRGKLPQAVLPDPVSAVITPAGDALVVSATGGLYATPLNEPDGWKRIQRVPGSLANLVFSPNRRFLAATGPSGILVWDWSTHRLFRQANLLDVKSLAFSADSNCLYAAVNEKGIQTFALDTRDVGLPKVNPPIAPKTPSPIPGVPADLPFSMNAPPLKQILSTPLGVSTSNLVPLYGDRLLTGSGMPFRIVNPYLGRGIKKIELKNDDVVVAGLSSKDWCMIYRPEEPAVLKLNHKTGEGTFLGDPAGERRGPITALAISPETPYAAAGTRDGQLIVFNTERAATEGTWDPNVGEIKAIAASPSGAKFAILGARGWAVLDQEQGKMIVRGSPLPAIPVGQPLSIVFAPGSDLVIVNGQGGLYASSLGMPDNWRRIQQLPGVFTNLRFSPDQKLLTAAGPPGILIWEWPSRRLVAAAPAVRNIVGLEFSPDSNFLFAGTSDKFLRTFSVLGGDPPPTAVMPPETVAKVDPTKSGPGAPKTPPTAKTEPPGADKLPDVQKVIQEQFAKDYLAAKKSPADRAALASKLLKLGQETTDDLASRFVLLSEARDLASQAGKWSTASEALDVLRNDYNVDGLGQRESSMQATLKFPALAKDDAEEIALAAMASIVECLAADRIETAQAFIAAGSAAAAKAKSATLTAQFKKHESELKSAANDFERFKKAQETLKTMPDDADSNLDAGRYLALRKADWDRGLAMLAKGAPSDLRDVARRDVENSTDVKKQQEVGDLWWGIADKEKESTWLRSAYVNRASYWYRAAADKAAGLTLTVLQDRIKLIDETPSPFHADTSAAANSRVFKGHKGAVTSLALAPDRKFFYSGSLDGTIRTWELASGKNTNTLSAAAPVSAFSISPNEAFVFTISKDGARVFQVAKAWAQIGRSAEPVGGAFWSGPASLFWTRASGGFETHYYPGGSSNSNVNFPIKGPNIAGDSVRNRFITLGDDVRLFRSTVLPNQPGVKLPVSDATFAIFHPDGITALIGSADKAIRLVDLNQNKVVSTFADLPDVPRTMALSESGKRLAFGGDSKGVYLWNVDTSKEVGRMTQHTGPVLAVAFTADGAQLLSASADSTIRVWQLPREKK